MASVLLNHLFKDPVSRCSHILKLQGLGFQHIDFGYTFQPIRSTCHLSAPALSPEGKGKWFSEFLTAAKIWMLSIQDLTDQADQNRCLLGMIGVLVCMHPCSVSEMVSHGLRSHATCSGSPSNERVILRVVSVGSISSGCCGGIVVVAQSLSHVWLFASPWTAACQATLSFTIYQSLLKLMSVESVMLFNCLILCLLSSISSTIKVCSLLHIRWLKCWSFSFSISSSNEYSGYNVEVQWEVTLLVFVRGRVGNDFVRKCFHSWPMLSILSSFMQTPVSISPTFLGGWDCKSGFFLMKVPLIFFFFFLGFSWRVTGTMSGDKIKGLS